MSDAADETDGDKNEHSSSLMEQEIAVAVQLEQEDVTVITTTLCPADESLLKNNGGDDVEMSYSSSNNGTNVDGHQNTKESDHSRSESNCTLNNSTVTDPVNNGAADANVVLVTFSAEEIGKQSTSCITSTGEESTDSKIDDKLNSAIAHVTDKIQERDDSEEDMSITEEAACTSTEPEPRPQVELRVIFNKNPILVNISLKKTVGDLKKIIEKSTNVTSALMKVLVKGNAKDEVTLESLGLTHGSKVLIIGTLLSDVMKVAQKPTEKELQDDSDVSGSSTDASKNWCLVPRHQKIIDKGLPEDVMPGISNCNDELPPFPIHGMVSTKGSKVRLTFKLESDELWIGTKERTEKVPIGSIKAVISQPITGFEHYHIMAIQLGPTEASRFYIYWVPAQYVEAIKSALSS